MKDRLHQIIQYKTNGRQTEFARLLGWTTGYLYRMLGGGSIGLQPIVSILSAFPEINARWLLLGEGSMLDSPTINYVSALMRAIELEKYMPVMSPQELARISSFDLSFSDEDIARWQQLLDQKHQPITDAMNRQK